MVADGPITVNRTASLACVDSSPGASSSRDGRVPVVTNAADRTGPTTSRATTLASSIRDPGSTDSSVRRGVSHGVSSTAASRMVVVTRMVKDKAASIAA